MKTIFTLLFILSSLQAFSQDPHFSNYANNPLQLNPALTGQIQGHANRLQIGSRDQWRSFLSSGAFNTSFIAFDKKFCSPIENDYWALGTSLMSDKRGDFPLYRFDAYLSGTYFKRLSNIRGKEVYLGLGFEGGAIHHRLGKDGFTFDEQFDDPAAPGEIFDNYSFTDLDYGVGLLFYVADPQISNFGFNFGAAIKHLGEPRYRFFEANEDDYIRRRYVVHAGINHRLKQKNMTLSWKGIFISQAPYQEILGSLYFIFGRPTNTMFSMGAGFRQSKSFNGSLSDAIIFSTSVDFHSALLSISYDTNVSSLQSASRSIGALEVSLAYTFGKDKCDLVYCPYW